MGKFEIEEGYDNILVGLGGENGLDFTLNNLLDFNSGLDQCMKANNIQRRQHNFPSTGGAGGQTQQMQQMQQVQNQMGQMQMQQKPVMGQMNQQNMGQQWAMGMGMGHGGMQQQQMMPQQQQMQAQYPMGAYGHTQQQYRH